MYFKKTAKGHAEIEGAARQLPQQLRMLLLLVDGKRSAVELMSMLDGATPEALRALLDTGHIVATQAPARRGSSASRRGPVTVAPAAADSVFKSSAIPSRFDIAVRPMDAEPTDKERAQIERSLRRVLGPAAESLIERVQRARTVHDLVEVLNVARKAISNARGADIADEFASRYGGLDET
jgi:hypothetical protein